jgi:hypothetical protein
VSADPGTLSSELYASGVELLPDVRADAGAATSAASTRPPTAAEIEGFTRSQELFYSEVAWLSGEEAGCLSHGELEERMAVNARELYRQMFEDHLERRAEQEQRIEPVVGADGVRRASVERAHERPLVTVFGKVAVRRFAYRARGHENLYPADGALNLPVEKHSHGLRRVCAIESARGSFEDACDATWRATGQRVAPRQLQQLARRSAQDFESFYAGRKRDACEPGEVLVLSCDGKGVVMRTDGLRDATRKQAQDHANKLKTRLSRGEKLGRKRIAEVAAVYEIEPAPRTVADILPANDSERQNAQAAPAAKHKWLTASVSDDTATVVAQMFQEAERRDHEHKHRWVALVDGNKHHCDTRSHATSERRKIGGSADVESVIPGPYSSACPYPDVRRRFRPVGFGARGKAQGRPFHPGVTGEGKPGRVKNLNLRLMPRHVEPRWWDAGTGCKDWPLGSSRRRLGMVPSRDEYRRPRGTGGTHPGRISCARNVVTPVGVRAVTSGKPTARKAQSPGGNLMIEKQMPAVERQQETGT